MDRKYIRKWIFIVLILTALSGCVFQKKRKMDTAVKNEVHIISKSYSPVSCFLASMNIEFKNTAGETEKGRVTLHADHTNNRMYLVVKDPLFGIEVIRLLKNGEDIKVWNIREKKTVSFPLSRFELRGLGNNSIRFPFTLFQNFLYGTLPEDLFDKKSKMLSEEGKLKVTRNLAGSSYEYRFVQNRLKSLTYSNRQDNTRADVSLNGRFKETIYPRTININAGNFNVDSVSSEQEKINITFVNVNQNVKCDDHFFQMR